MLKNATVLLVRHGEKPGDPNTDSKGDGPGLSPAGQARALTYVHYFSPFTATSTDGSKTRTIAPQWVFSTADNPGTSYRPRLTITPFADTALLPFACKYPDEKYADLVDDFYGDKTYDDANILICWHHGKLLELANAILTNNGKLPMPALPPAATWPTAWPGTVFGWVMQIVFDADGVPDPKWTRCFNEALMPGDTVEP